MVGYAASTEQGRYGWAEFSGTINQPAQPRRLRDPRSTVLGG
jgi:hypothetical protein